MSKELKITRISSVETFKREQKELHALEIIKEKHVQISWFTKLLKIYPNYTESDYNFALPDDMRLSEEEYNILKEVLQ